MAKMCARCEEKLKGYVLGGRRVIDKVVGLVMRCNDGS